MEFLIKTNKREEIIDITEKVKELVEKASEGKACLISTPHTTCSIIINEVSNKAICEDILDFLKQQIPRGKWKHDLEEGNADGHIKASILGASKVIPIEQGKLILGTYQRIGLAEFDGPRERRIIVKIL